MSDDYDLVAEGKFCEVWLHKSAVKEVRRAPVNDRAKVTRILEHLCEVGDEDFPDTQFKFEARIDVGHKKVAVYVVKAFQLRIMGGWCEGTPRRFVCPEAVIKKRNQADRSQLERVAKKVGEYRGS